MNYTLTDAQRFVYREIRGGSAPDSALVTDRINQALGLALKEQYSAGMFNAWDVATNVRERELLLPPEIKTAELVASPLGGDVPVRTEWFRFVTETYRLSDVLCSPLEVEDAGDGHIQETALCEPKRILALVEKPYGSPNAEREQASIFIQGIGGDDRPVWGPNGEQGFALQLSDQRPKYSDLEHMSVRVKEITSVQKPQTNWPVVLYAYDAVSEAELRDGVQPTLTQLARLMPWETSVSRRKYRFIGDGEVPPVVRVFGVLRFRPLTQGQEVLPIQDLDAIRQFVMRLESEREGKLNDAVYHQQQAKRDLDKGLRQHVGAQGESEAIQFTSDGSSGYGDLHNINY